MTNSEKANLRRLVKEGWNFKEIRKMVDCSDSTIRNYIKCFGKFKEEDYTSSPEDIKKEREEMSR